MSMAKEYIYKSGLKLRKIPYPYSSIFAICSDLDQTPDKDVYFETMRYLNTDEQTKIGKGIGLEVGNTIYFDMPADQFAYWNTDNDGREIIQKLIKSGHIDCIHSYGDYAYDRSFAERAIHELIANGCFIKIWVDHAQAITNVGGDIMRGYGDIPDHLAYHTDLWNEYGIKYVWKGRVTSVIGQETKRSYRGILHKDRIRSVKTLGKQIIKDILGSLGNKKYLIHGNNALTKKIALRDNYEVTEFIRCNPYWGGVDEAATAQGIADVITEKYLERLVKAQGISILYTHLGKIADKNIIFDQKTKSAFLLLKDYAEKKKLLVTTTFRALEYAEMLSEIKLSVEQHTKSTDVYVKYQGDINSLQGLTIVNQNDIQHNMIINNQNSILMEKHTDQYGDFFYSMPWNKLNFPKI